METGSFARRTHVNTVGRNAPITTYGNGPQLSPNSSHHVMQPSSGVNRFSFSISFWQFHDDIEWKSEDDDIDNPSDTRNSLLVQDYHNVTKNRGSIKFKNTMKSG